MTTLMSGMTLGLPVDETIDIAPSPLRVLHVPWPSVIPDKRDDAWPACRVIYIYIYIYIYNT